VSRQSRNIECRAPLPAACRKESPGILKVNLSQRKQHRDCRNNDDKGHKREISRVDSFFALQVSRLVQISHRSLPSPRWQSYIDSDQKSSLLTARRFPPPWSLEEQPACFVVRDHNGQQLAYVYFEDEPGRRSAAKLLSKDARQSV
jgi:hypothetical protein